ncbi:MAG: zf-HC2 domain-containing protein [Acidimicrobiales bacterium]
MSGTTGRDAAGGHPGDLLSAWLDGELEPEDAAAVASHVDSCSACAAERDEVQAGRLTLRSLPLLEAPPAVLEAYPAVHLADVLSACLDDEIDADLRAGIDAHLAACPACAAEHDEVAWARAKLRAMPQLDPPAGTLRPPFARPTPSGRRPVQQGTSGRQLVAAAAAVVAAGVGVLGVIDRSALPDAASPTVASFASRQTSVPQVSSPALPVVFSERSPSTDVASGGRSDIGGARTLPEPASPSVLSRLRQASRYIVRHLV